VAILVVCAMPNHHTKSAFGICSTKTAVAANQLCIGGFDHRGFLVFGILVFFIFFTIYGGLDVSGLWQQAGGHQ